MFSVCQPERSRICADFLPLVNANAFTTEETSKPPEKTVDCFRNFRRLECLFNNEVCTMNGLIFYVKVSIAGCFDE